MQAARHSRLVMWVAGSQNRMQSSSVLPPPPGVLGAASLEPGESASEPCLAVPPPDKTLGDTCGDKGAMAGTWGAGAPIAEGGPALPVADGGDGEG
jgi:hypothetical protein